MTTRDELFAAIEKIAEGRIQCECGNADWHEFLFAGIPPACIGGCKRCGRCYTYKEGTWVMTSGPAIKPDTAE